MNNTRKRFSPEVRERAVRLVGEHRADYGSEWEAMTSIASKIGCTAETLRRWCRQEMAGRVLRRVVSPVVSDHVMARLRWQGIDIRLGTGLAAIEGRDGKTCSVTTSVGKTIPADLVVLGIGIGIGIGIDPDCALAKDAGLACDDGILVDETLTTSHPDILAIGDCTRFDHWHAGRSVRLESVQNATDQARLAARTIMGGRLIARCRGSGPISAT